MRRRRREPNSSIESAHAAWWLELRSFQGLRRPFLRVYYLGGLSGRDVRDMEAAKGKARRLAFGPGGVTVSSAVRMSFLVPWADIDALDVVVADDGKAVLVVRLKHGDEGRFVIEHATPDQLRGKLSRIIDLIESSRELPETGRRSTASPTDVSDDFARLARLHDAGALTDAEFVAARNAALAKRADSGDA